MFQNYQPNIENMQQYLSQEQEKNSGEGPNWWSIPSGMSVVRILPPWDPTGRVSLPVYMHPIEFKGKDMSFTKYNWTCVNKTFGKSCPICEGLAGLSAAGVDTSNWDANRRQYYFNAIVMHDPTFDQQKGKGTAPGTHVLMKSPKTFYDWIISQITNPMIGDITSVTSGIDVYITKEGTGLGTTYSMTLSPNGRTAVPGEYLEKIQSLYDLDKIFSAGFEQSQIDELVDHLRRSAGVMNNTIGNTVQQMAGYQQAPPVVPPQQLAPVQYQQTPQIPPYGGNNAPIGGVAPTPYIQGVQPNVAPVIPDTGTVPQPVPVTTVSQQPAPVSTDQSANLPKCFGQYDSGSVTCVVCPHEINCSQSK